MQKKGWRASAMQPIPTIWAKGRRALPVQAAEGCDWLKDVYRTQPLDAPVPNKDQPTVSRTLVALRNSTGVALVDRPESLGLAAPLAELAGVNSGANGRGTAAATVHLTRRHLHCIILIMQL
jgi:hypothetical protein